MYSTSQSDMKQNCRPLSKCRWPASNQPLSKTEGSFKNWTMLRWKKCHEL